MNNLHRELAPVSEAAWAEIEEEASRTLKRYLAGRRVVDVHGPAGTALSAVGTGHLRDIAAPAEGVIARQREVKALVELRVPFELDRQADRRRRTRRHGFGLAAGEGCRTTDRLCRGPRDLRGLCRRPALKGIRQGTSNPRMTLPADARGYPEAIAQALSQLRLVGVNGPYRAFLGADAYTAARRDHGPGLSGLAAHQTTGRAEIIWAPAVPAPSC